MVLIGGFIAALLVLLFLGMPFMFAMGILGFAGTVYIIGFEAAVASIAQFAVSFTCNFTMSCIPLFILMGLLAIPAKVADDLYDVSYKWFGRLPGGLATSTIGTGAMLGAITGTSVTTVVTIGEFATREMESRGYDRDMSAATVCGASVLGGLIPPSLLAVIYAMILEISPGKQLMAGLLPGLASAFLYAVMIMIRARFNPSLAPAARGISWREALWSLRKLWSVIVVFGIVLGGIYTGVLSPTEASGAGALVMLIVALWRTGFRWEPLKKVFLDTVNLTGLIWGIFIGASIAKLFFALTRAPMMLATTLSGMKLSPELMTLLLIAPFFPLGMVLDAGSMILLTVPIYYGPIHQLGINPYVFGVLLMKIEGIAVMTPPVAINIMLMHGIRPDIPFMSIAKQCLWFILMDVIIVVLIVFLPQIATWLPGMM